MTANTPAKPHTEGMEWTNTETGIKYMFTNGGWRAVSSEASEEVADAISRLDLQTVLDNGNVADKGATFDEPISVGFDEFNPLESHAVTFGYYDEGQGVQNDNISDLQVSVATLQQEIEALGTVINKSVPHKLIKQPDDVQSQLDDGGFYFGDCPAGNMLDVPDDWSGICFIYVDTIDNNGDFADFGPDSLDPGDLIEGVSDTGYFLIEVGSGGYDEGAGKKIAGIEATLIKASGVPGPAGQDYALTAFRLTSDGGIDLPTADERYVRKTGDEITGTLKIETSEGMTAGNALRIKAGRDLAANQNIFDVRSGANNQLFWIDSKNIGTSAGYTPTKDEHIANKQYVDEEIQTSLTTAALPGPCVFQWKYKGDVDMSTLEAGEFCGPSNPQFNNSTNYTYAFHKNSLTLNSDFYKRYDQYFKMGHVWASIWFNGSNIWKCKGNMPIRNIYWQDSRNPDCFAIKTHTDFDDNTNNKLMGTLTVNSNYWLTISGIL